VKREVDSQDNTELILRVCLDSTINLGDELWRARELEQGVQGKAPGQGIRKAKPHETDEVLYFVV